MWRLIVILVIAGYTAYNYHYYPNTIYFYCGLIGSGLLTVSLIVYLTKKSMEKKLLNGKILPVEKVLRENGKIYKVVQFGSFNESVNDTYWLLLADINGKLYSVFVGSGEIGKFKVGDIMITRINKEGFKFIKFST